MSFYIIIRRQIVDGFYVSSINSNPSVAALLNDIKSYPKIYVFTSLEDARIASQFFFNERLSPRDSGSYGLIAEVTMTSTGIPETSQIDEATLYNNWVDSQKLKYTKRESQGFEFSCITVSHEQIKSISHTYIPDDAKAYNGFLRDMDYTNASPACCIL